MEAKTNFNSRLPSRHVSEGPARMWSSLPSREAFADSVERKALENADVVAASGCSSNAALHQTAAAHECGIAFDLFDGAEVFKRTPYIADLKPAGRFVAKDLFEAEASFTADEDIVGQRFCARRLHDRDQVRHGRKLETCGLELLPGDRNGQRPESHGWRADRMGRAPATSSPSMRIGEAWKCN